MITSFIFLILTLTTIDADVIENNNLKVSLSKDSGLVMINEVMLKESRMFDVDVASSDLKQNLTLTNEVCTYKETNKTNVSVTYVYACQGFPSQDTKSIPANLIVRTNYALRSSFLTKTISIGSTRPYSSTEGEFTVLSATLFDSLYIEGSDSVLIQSNPYQSQYQIVAFSRNSRTNVSAFVSAANPFTQITESSRNLTARVEPHFTQTPEHPEAYYEIEPAILGLVHVTSKYVDILTNINIDERRSFLDCVTSFLLDSESRQDKSVKVNVAWDENDYQIDVGTSAGVEEYRRIIDRNSEWGVTHVVYEPRNTLHSSRFNSTDGWGWEGSLWFSMGEAIREGTWSPIHDDVPNDIMSMVSYAASKNVKLMAYVYPCLLFQEMSDYWIGGALDISAPQVTNWLYNTLSTFMDKTGAGGFAWDHDIFAGDSTKHYSQWRAWMQILKQLRAKFPDMVMDHRQTNHMWGPFYQLAGSYAEPIAGDENPETYGVPITSLHTDHVSANNMRIVNRVYASEQLIPPSRVPGFIFHQTERTDDNGTNACFGSEALCYDMNTRDFDLMGYKYSLLSSVGTAGCNMVFTMIPARNKEEYDLFPSEDSEFVKRWLKFTDDNVKYLRNTMPIPTLGSPSLSGVDGTAAMYEDEGYLFLFNPSYVDMPVQLVVDESIGLSSSTSSWSVTRLFPGTNETYFDTWNRDQNVTVNVTGSSALVLKLSKTSNTFFVSGRRGETISLSSSGHDGIVNGVRCEKDESSSNEKLYVRFKGDVSNRALGPLPDKHNTGNFTYETSFTITDTMKTQLSNRAKEYPIDWQPHEYNATWLVPTRLLAYVFIDHPQDTWTIDVKIDGNSVDMSRAYNSRGLVRSRCFLGFYVDCTSLLDDESPVHNISVGPLPTLPSGAFQGVFWENIEYEYTSEVESCWFV